MKTILSKKISWQLLSKYRNEIYGISILWIMLFHSYLCGYGWKTPLRIINIGNMGCELFLFLSGICLYFSFQSNSSTLDFYKKRVIRLYVPIFCICTLYWLYQLKIGYIGKKILLLDLTGLKFWITGDQQIWFISFILTAYLLYPLLYRFLYRSKDNTAIALRLLFLMACFYGAIILISKLFPTWYNLVEIGLTRWPIFLLGMGFGKMVYEKKTYPAILVIIFAFIFAVSVKLILDGLFTGMGRRFFYIFGGFTLPVVLSVILDCKLCAPFRKFFAFLGSISLELYILNIILINLYKSGNFVLFQKGNFYGYIILVSLNIQLAYLFSLVTTAVSAWMRKKIF